MPTGFPPTPFSLVTAPHPGEPSWGTDIRLTRRQVRALERTSIQITHPFPTRDGTLMPRTLDVSVGLAKEGAYASVEDYFPEGADCFSASSYRVVLSEEGRERLTQGKQVYCALGTAGSFWLKPAP